MAVQRKKILTRTIRPLEPLQNEVWAYGINIQVQKPRVFVSKTAFGRIDIKKAGQQALKRVGITNYRAHDMRHTFCAFAAAQ
jgi:integrase